MRKFIIAAAFCLAAGPAPAQQPHTEGEYFTVTVPKDWARKEELLGLGDADRKVYGSEWFGPAAGKFAVRIGAHYYAPDNLLHPTAEKFIKLHSQPALGANLNGKVFGKVKDGKAGNYYARVFERKTFEYDPPGALHPKKVHIYEKFYVAPVKNGFYVLRYYAPMDLAKANLKKFEEFVASFKPLKR